jgi:hypothetical protein
MSQPDYLSISPPSDKPTSEYTWAERRAEIADAIEQQGHHRLLERSQYELGREYGVTQNQIKEDIQRINEQRASQLGNGAEAELDTLKTRAIEDALERGDSETAYRIMAEHYEILLKADAADQEKDPDKSEVEHSGDIATVPSDDQLEDLLVDLEDYR